VISWRPGVVPHFLFIGPTGAGKTSTSRCVISGVTRSGWAMWIADVKRIEFRDFRDWPNVQVVASSIPQIVAMIHQAWRVMMQRYDLVESGQARVTDFEPLFVLIDEYTEFLNSLRSWYAGVKVKGDPTVPRTLDEVASILRLGRSGRVHLIKTAQRPDIALFGGAAAGEMRDNLGQRMSLGRLSPNGALMMWEDASVGVSIPRGLVGRGTTTGVDGHPVEAQAYRFPDIDAPAGSQESALLEQLRPSRTVHERLLILEPEIQDEEQPLTWHHYAETPWVKASDRARPRPVDPYR
jgi:S-DNA-T family DNA segregation ATPase FtsK/SpoIIIE